MKIAIRHELTLQPGEFPGRSVQHLLLTPLSGVTQKVLEWSIEADGITRAASFIDGFGNRAHLINQTRRDGPLSFIAEGVVETHDHHGVVGRMTGEPMPALYLRSSPLTRLEGEPDPVPDVADRIGFLHSLMVRVGDMLAVPAPAPKQEQSEEQGDQKQTQDAGKAQDTPLPPDAARHAHLFIARARAAGIPARFVTGYLAGDDGTPGFHCWAEAYDTGLGWIGFDPMLGYCPTEQHVRLAMGIDATNTLPVRAVPFTPEAVDTTVKVDIIAPAAP